MPYIPSSTHKEMWTQVLTGQDMVKTHEIWVHETFTSTVSSVKNTQININCQC